jgi:mRNA interferase HigB
MPAKGNSQKKQSSQKGNCELDTQPHFRKDGMRIIAVRTLRDFWKQHADAEQALKSWYHEAQKSNWSQPVDIKQHFPSADILPGNRVVFNIKGNTYRLIVKFHYDRGVGYIRFVGTHAEYDKIDANSI